MGGLSSETILVMLETFGLSARRPQQLTLNGGAGRRKLFTTWQVSEATLMAETCKQTTKQLALLAC